MAIDGLTDTQAKYFEAVQEHGGVVAAARALGVHHSSIGKALARAARLGKAPGHFQSGVAPGYAMGKVTVQRAADGSVERTWERQSPDAQDLEGFLKTIEARFSADAVRPAPITMPPVGTDGDLLAV